MSHRPRVAVRRLLAAIMVLASLATLAPTGAAQTDRGLIDDTSYQSPQFGYPVTWTEPWAVDERDVVTNPGGFDTITIRSDSGTVRISGRADDYDALTFLMDTIAIQEASGGVVIDQDTTGDVPSAELQVGLDRMRLEVVSLPEAGAIVLVSLRASEGAYDTAYTSAHDGIQMNGAAIFDSPAAAAPGSQEPAAAVATGAPESDEAAQAPPPVSTVEPLGSGVEGNAYTSPSFGFSVSWDPAVWSLSDDAEYSEPGYDSLRLETATGPLWITGWQSYDGNAATCLAGEQTYYNDPESGVTDWQVAVDASGAELTEATADRAWGVFTNVYTDPEDPAAQPNNYVDYLECVSLGDGESVVIFYSFAERDAYNDHIGNVLGLIETLELPAASGTPTATATTPAETPTAPATTPAETPTAPATTPAQTPATTPAQTPATTGGQPVTVGQTQLTWTGAWEYDDTSSMAEQATLTQIDSTTGGITLASYGEFVDGTVTSAEQALDTFAGAFFQGAGASGQTELNSGTLDDGTVWKLYRFELQGLSFNMVITVSQPDGGAYVVSTLTTNEERFAGAIPQAQQEILLDGQPVFLAGIDAETILTPTTGTPTETATTASQTPAATATTPVTTPSPTAEGSPTAVSSSTGLTAGDTVTGQTYAYSFTIPAGWQANESTLGGAVERTVLTNGTSTVAIEARAMTAPTLSDCVANIAGEHQGQPVYTDLELARTASGDPFSGEDNFSAFANFTFTGPAGEPWAHFVECRWVVEGESVLVVIQDVPQDQFGAERAARRQIQNTLEVGE